MELLDAAILGAAAGIVITGLSLLLARAEARYWAWRRQARDVAASVDPTKAHNAEELLRLVKKTKRSDPP